jgi:hypothetical protein
MKRIRSTTFPSSLTPMSVAVGFAGPAVTLVQRNGAESAPVSVGCTRVALATVRPIWALRLYAARKERGLSRITPLTVRVSEQHSEARRLFYAHAMQDGELDADEQPVLDALDEAGRLFSLVDCARRTADWIRDTGTLPKALDISPYLQREWRELGAEPDTAA